MANQDQVAILKQGVEVWNHWRDEYNVHSPKLDGANLSCASLMGAKLSGADLRAANLMGANLSEANFSEANLSNAALNQANLSQANLFRANLSQANLSEANLFKASLMDANLMGANLSQADLYAALLVGANLSQANLSQAKLSEASLETVNLSNAALNQANLSHANLCRANLSQANLSETNLFMAFLIGANLMGANFMGAKLIGTNFSLADLRGANLSNANLEYASLVETNCEGTIFGGCRVFGVSAWDIKLTGADQRNLIITPHGKPIITVDNLNVAQFIYLLLNNTELRDVIDTITSKVVLILGRFTPDRKVVLDALREQLRTRGYTPIVFDFDKPASRDITETVSALAHMARFVIADITDAKSIPQELMAIVPHLPSVPVQPLLLVSQHEYGMFEHFKRYPWVLETFLYQNQNVLLSSLESSVILPAEEKAKALRPPPTLQ